MPNAVFTYSPSSKYDDQPEVRYHFPKTYLRVAEEAVGDWILYYEPRRTEGASSSAGRQSYIAMARVTRVVPDDQQPDHYYAYVADYLEFDSPVPFRANGKYFESILMKEDGTTSKGAFGRNMRSIPRYEFDYIVKQGFERELPTWEVADRARDPAPESVDRPLVEQVIRRPFRDEAFRRAERYLAAGADGLFIESPHDVAELEQIGRKFDVPQMANMLEGGRTPILPPAALGELGFGMAVYGISLLMHSVRTMQGVLAQLARGDIGFIGKGVGFEEYKSVVGFDAWAGIEDRHGVR